jgi:hypothetical protein
MSAVQASISVPAKTDPRWRNLVLGTQPVVPKLLALKFMLSRITLATRNDQSPATVQKGIDELFEFFQRNPKIVAADAASLFPSR